MSRVDTAKDRLGLDDTGQPYDSDDPDEREIDLETVENPHTQADNTKKTWRETWAENKWAFFAHGLLALIALTLFLYWGFEFLAPVFTNIWVWIGLGVVIWNTAVWLHGHKHQRGIDSELDQYVQHSPSEDAVLVSFDGILRQSTFDGRRRFIPVKGSRWFGLKHEPYRRRDIGLDENPDQPLRIRLDTEAKARSTEKGTIVSQVSPGLKRTPDARHTELEALRAEKAPEDHVKELNREIENLETQLADAETVIETLEQQLEKAREDARKTRDEHLDDYTEWYTEMRESEPSQVTAHTGLESSLSDIERSLGDNE